MSKTAFRTAISAVFVLAALSLAACGDDGGAEAETGETAAVKRPSAKASDYYQTEYDVSTTWEQKASDEKVGNYLESVWQDPAVPKAKAVIDSRPAEGAPPPMMAAELARIQVNRLPEYRERGFKRVKLGKQPMVRFAYEAEGEAHVVYFFEKCGTSIVMRGSMSFIAYEPFSEFYGEVASRIKPVCNE